MEPITRKEFYLAKAAGTYTGPTPSPVLREDYYLATLAGDYSGSCPSPMTRIQIFMAAAAGVYSGALPEPVTREERFWAAIVYENYNGEPRPITREEYWLAKIAKRAALPEVVDKESSGTSLTLSSAAAPLTALTLYGKSEQETTTGAQLLNTEELKSIDCEFSVLGDGYTIQLNATVPDDNEGKVYSCLYFGFPDSYAGKTLTASYENFITTQDNETYDLGYMFKLNGGTTGCLSHMRKNGNVYTATIPENVTNIFLRLFLTESTSDELTPGENISATFTGLTLCEGSSALPWEPYTGGQPSPSPDYPQEIQSTGDSGTINITLSDGGSQSQTLPVSTPNGLPGIPVDSGGNYTDADGQQWVCDEVDFARGVYVQRIEKKVVNTFTDGTDYNTTIRLVDNNADLIEINNCILSTVASAVNSGSEKNTCRIYMGGNIFLFVSKDEFADLNAANEFFADNPVEFFVGLATPIETPLSAEQISAYKALHTYSPATTVSNDEEAWMKVGYKSPQNVGRIYKRNR